MFINSTWVYSLIKKCNLILQRVKKCISNFEKGSIFNTTSPFFILKIGQDLQKMNFVYISYQLAPEPTCCMLDGKKKMIWWRQDHVCCLFWNLHKSNLFITINSQVQVQKSYTHVKLKLVGQGRSWLVKIFQTVGLNNLRPIPNFITLIKRIDTKFN